MPLKLDQSLIAPIMKPPFNFFILSDHVLSWAATPTRIQLRLTHKQGTELLDRLSSHYPIMPPPPEPEPDLDLVANPDLPPFGDIAIAVLQNIIEVNAQMGATPDYWRSPEGRAITRDSDTLKRALKILQAGGIGKIYKAKH